MNRSDVDEAVSIAGALARYMTSLTPSSANPYAEKLAAYSPALLWGSKSTFYVGLAGAASAATIASRNRNRQFLAENAHRLPKTKEGWYIYHRYKQLEIFRAASSWSAAPSGALRFGSIAASFCVIEHLFETRLLSRESWANAFVAGISSGALFSIAARLTIQYSKRAIFFGSMAGLSIGVLQDVAAFATGVSVKNPKKLRSGSLDFWIPFWDWDRGLDGFGVFRRGS
ncbi:hypothetical protein HK100_011826 [Physocladia obscura]|uniref:Uncharacterized protein n=1 Tax=Physocladia obscura TaxID=109957 RepID=A0AAD5TA04_9FUNG|nr:hypothetical protein HK100_011826 [Physocladia obscura]